MALGDELFLRAGAVDVDAAVIGVGCTRWSSLSPEDAASTEKAIQTMRTHRFDVLPIDEGIDKPIYDYFHTQGWGKWTDETVVRSLVHNKESLDKLWDRMEKLQDVLFRLRQLQGIN